MKFEEEQQQQQLRQQQQQQLWQERQQQQQRQQQLQHLQEENPNSGSQKEILFSRKRILFLNTGRFNLIIYSINA